MERPQIVSEMRDLSTKNSAEIRDAVEDGKRRIAKLVTEGKTLVPPSDAPASDVAAAPAAPAKPSTEAPRPKLDDLMLSMDVVDTLRHQEDLVARELDEDHIPIAARPISRQSAASSSPSSARG
jgi:hypothetical protein